MSERNIADAFDRWLRNEGLLFRRDRMDKATTCMRGWPDVEILAGGKSLFIELKTDKGRLSRDQVNAHARFAKAGYTVFVMRDIGGAIDLVTQWLSTLGEIPSKPIQTTIFGGRKYDITADNQLINPRDP